MPINDAPDTSFHADNPIQTWEEDLFDLRPFIRRLVGPVLRAPSDSSLVLGLFGAWGQGKSSALNLLARELDAHATRVRRAGEATTPTPLLIRFTPWLYHGVDALLAGFFETLASALGISTLLDAESKRILQRALRGLERILVPTAHLAGPTGSGVAVGAAFRALVGAPAESSVGELAFRAKRAAAAKVLRKLGSGAGSVRVIVMIDDLDRVVTTDEVVAMLKAIRVVADLPNVSYVVAMDRGRIESLLAPVAHGESSVRYLDKIVQVPITLPKPDPEHLIRVVVKDATAIATAAELDIAPLDVRWSSLHTIQRGSYEAALRPALSTMRDVARVLNAFRFAALAVDRPPVMHAADLLLLCALHALFPDVYERVRDDREFLLGHEALRDLGSAEADARRETHLATLAGLGEYPSPLRGDEALRRRAAALRIVEYLFPNAGKWRAQGGDAALREATHTGRIRAVSRFDGYFRLVAPANEAPQALVRATRRALLTYRTDVDPLDALRTAIAAVELPLRDSLWTQVLDSLAVVTGDEIDVLARAIPVVASAATLGMPPDVVEELALVVARYRRAVERADTSRAPGEVFAPLQHSAAVDVLVETVSSLPAIQGYLFADRLLRTEIDNLLGIDDAPMLAARGLERADAALTESAVVWDPTQPIPSLEQFWAIRRLAERMERIENHRFPPLTEYLQTMVKKSPEALSIVLALASSWGNGPSLGLREPEEVGRVLAKLVPLDWISVQVRTALAAGHDTGVYPHLAKQFADIRAGMSDA